MAPISYATDSPRHSMIRIAPRNNSARLAFDLQIRKASPSAHHWKYIHFSRSPHSTGQWYDCPRELHSRLSLQDLKEDYGGWWELPLDNPRVNPIGCVWTIGAGRDEPGISPRGVDIQLTPMDTPFRGVSAVHAILEIHPRSGALMVTGVDDKYPVFCEAPEGADELRRKKSRVLLYPVNIITIGSLEYEVTFEHQSPDQYSNFVTLRDQMFRDLKLTIPHPLLNAIPTRTPVQLGDSILHETISSGAFGVVCSGVDISSGEPLAVKSCVIKNLHGIRAFKIELAFSQISRKEQGLLQAHGAECQHGGPLPCGRFAEQMHIKMPLAETDFASHKWTNVPTQRVIAFLRGPLEGLVALHKAGVMHRDVTLNNMLIMSYDPPAAVLCDFGKAVKATSHNNPHIGPMYTLAPEIKFEECGSYDNKIDVWSFGYACCGILFPKSCWNTNQACTRWQKEIMEVIADYRLQGSLENNLGSVVSCMLDRDPYRRYTAEHALKLLGGPLAQRKPEPIPRFSTALFENGEIDRLLANQIVVPMFEPNEPQQVLIPLKRKRGISTQRSNPALRKPFRPQKESVLEQNEEAATDRRSHGLTSLFEGDSQIRPGDTAPLSVS